MFYLHNLRGKVREKIVDFSIYPNFLVCEGWGFCLKEMKYFFGNTIAIVLLQVLLLTGLACPETGKGMKPGDEDTTKTYVMRPVTVTAPTKLLDRLDSPSRTRLFSPQDIRSANWGSVGTIVGGMPGVFLREYGTGGSLQTLSFRGMGAEHTDVLLDGVPVNNKQYGLTDLRLFPIEVIQSVEVIRGGASADFGSGALGGVVNLLTREMNQDQYMQFNGSLGSFGSNRFGVSTHLTMSSDAMVTFGVSAEHASNRYPFTINQGGMNTSAVRENSDCTAQDIFLKSSWFLTSPRRLDITMSSFSIERGIPGALLTTSNQGAARQSDNQVIISVSLEHQEHAKLAFDAAGNFQNSYERYLDPSGISRADNYYRNISMTIIPKLRYEITPVASTVAGIELGNDLANGNALAERKVQTHAGAFVQSEVSLSSDSSGNVASLFPSIRLDAYGEGREAWSPRFGVKLRLPLQRTEQSDQPIFTLHSTIGRDFRVPTFNERYYAGAGGVGNPSLLPERSLSFDCGVSFEYSILGKQEFDATYYSINTDNRILWLPTASVSIYSPVNVPWTTSTGLETEFRWSIPSDILELEGNYSILNARKKFSSTQNDPTFDKQLIYIPLETGNIAVKLKIPVHESIVKEGFLLLKENYIGERFVVEDNSQSLPAYGVLGGNFGVELQSFGAVLRLKYEVNNITDISYEVMPRYPMPLRNQNVSLSLMKTY